MCVPNIEIFDTLSTFVNDEQKMDGNFCLFIIFTVLMVAIKRVLSVLEKLSHPNNCYADIVHSSSSGFVVGSNYYHLKQPTSVVIVGVSQTFCWDVFNSFLNLFALFVFRCLLSRFHLLDVGLNNKFYSECFFWKSIVAFANWFCFVQNKFIRKAICGVHLYCLGTMFVAVIFSQRKYVLCVVFFFLDENLQGCKFFVSSRIWCFCLEN